MKFITNWDLGFWNRFTKTLFFVLRENGLMVDKQVPLAVYFRDKVVGNYKVDLMVEEKVLIELKAVRTILAEHEAQIINYLKATKIDVGLLMNFEISQNSNVLYLMIKEIIR